MPGTKAEINALCLNAQVIAMAAGHKRIRSKDANEARLRSGLTVVLFGLSDLIRISTRGEADLRLFHRICCLALIHALLVSGGVSLAGERPVKTLRIIATSDLHGKFMPWDYALDQSSTAGSVAQLATALAVYRDGNTLLLDAGDTIQDNSADIFLDEPVHPMILALNALDYDVWVTGNHEYNYGMDVLRKTIAGFDGVPLVGNVYDENDEPLADGCTIFEVNGLRVAVIGMVTPNIARWDMVNLAGCTVRDPLEETRRIIDGIRGQYDLLVGVFHMGIGNQLGTDNSGVTDILMACPEFDVMVSSHEHERIPGMDINGVLVVQNRSMAQTMSVIDVTLEAEGDGWKVVKKTSASVDIAGFEPDPAVVSLLGDYDERARNDARTVIGRLEGSALAPENGIAGIPAALIRDTALVDLINEVQMYYTGADVSAAALCRTDANLVPGDIRKCDISLIYRFSNTLCKLHMTGAQLKRYMEWSVSFYHTFKPGDLTISFDPEIHIYNYDMFSGVCYEVNIAREPGSRIEHLTWPDGTPVKDDDEFDIAVNNYRAATHLLAPGEIFEADDMPILLEIDVHGEIGGVRELIRDYIVNVRGGVLIPGVDENWRITGCQWDEAQHRRAVEMLAAGDLSVPVDEEDRFAVRSVTEADLQ